MNNTADQRYTASQHDADGVRIFRQPWRRWQGWLVWTSLLLLSAGIGLALSVRQAGRKAPAAISQSQTEAAPQPDIPPSRTVPSRSAESPLARDRRLAAALAAVERFDSEALSGDANDIASYVSEDDPEPSMAELIEALRHAGETGGIAAFNPPGTSPLLEGLAVPADFDLPEGYVRHHQVTDDGVAVEPILMYSPDHEFYDAYGNPVEIPDDRVVPPEGAPHGLPIQRIVTPPPP